MNINTRRLLAKHGICFELIKNGVNASFDSNKKVRNDIYVDSPNGEKHVKLVTTQSDKALTNFMQHYADDSSIEHIPDYWIIAVYSEFPEDGVQDYYIFTHNEMRECQLKEHGRTSSKKYVLGVDQIQLRNVVDFKEQWETILKFK